MAEQTKFSDQTVQALIDAGRQLAAPTAVQTIAGNPVPFIIVNGKVTPLPDLVFNEHAEHPERVKADVTVLDSASFIEYYTLFSDENSRVFADETMLAVTGVLDYHGARVGAPRWCDHSVKLTLRQSEEWKRWIGKNNVRFSQQEFAEFLEQNSIDITNPSPAAMMEVARDLQAHTEVEFAAGTRMTDGQMRFKYTETTTSSVGAGKVDVPEKFTVTLPAFVGGERVPMDALLRFRVNQGKLVIWYTLVRQEEVQRTAFIASRNQIADALHIVIINGAPNL